MLNLFSLEKLNLNLPDAEFIYIPNFISHEKGIEYFNNLLQNTPWQQDDITIFGKKIAQPRHTSLYGNGGKSYSYSGLTMQPNSWTPLLYHLKELVEKESGQIFTTVLLNLYRNEKDSNGWHSDNERELGRDPYIASLSLGEVRRLQLKHNTKPKIKFNLELEHGSLLLMKSGSQIHYKHQIPKSTKLKKERINLTFRTLL